MKYHVLLNLKKVHKQQLLCLHLKLAATHEYVRCFNQFLSSCVIAEDLSEAFERSRVERKHLRLDNVKVDRPGFMLRNMCEGEKEGPWRGIQRPEPWTDGQMEAEPGLCTCPPGLYCTYTKCRVVTTTLHYKEECPLSRSTA